MLGVAIALTVLSIVIYKIADETRMPHLSYECMMREFVTNTNTQFVRGVLEIYSSSASNEETEVICRYCDIAHYVHIAEELKPEIEQKYNVTILPYYDGYHITPNGNYKSEYWS